MVKIDSKIISCNVVKDTPLPPLPKNVPMERPPVLAGRTYKIAKSPLSESAMYITLNDHEGKPFEVFINSKDTKHYQWTIALTRVISAVFRKGGDCTFLIEELKSIHDPNGGYFNKNHYVPSLVAEIGDVLEQHFTELGLYKKDNSLAVAAQEMVKEKLKKLEESSAESKMLTCQKCNQKSAILMDGCLTCVNPDCLYSKCG